MNSIMSPVTLKTTKKPKKKKPKKKITWNIKKRISASTFFLNLQLGLLVISYKLY